MIIPLELLLITILAAAGWTQNRWLLLLFVVGQIFVIAEFIISVIAALRFRVELRSFEGGVRLGHISCVRAFTDRHMICGRRLRIRAVLTLPSGEKKRLSYHMYTSDMPLSLPVPALSVGENVFTIKSIRFMDAAGIFFFYKRIDKSVIIPVVPDEDLMTDISPDDILMKDLEKDTVTEKGNLPARDDIRSFREYRYGDEKRDIHWNISARFGRYYVKEYEGSDITRDVGENKKSGRYSTESDENKSRSLLSEVKNLSFEKKNSKPHLPAGAFITILRGVFTAAIVMIFFSQMTILSHPFTFDVMPVVLSVILSTAAITITEFFGKYRNYVSGIITAVAAVIFLTDIRGVTGSVSVFARWCAGSYKYNTQTPYTSLTTPVIILCLLTVVILFRLLEYRISSVIIMGAVFALYLVRYMFGTADTYPLTASALSLAAVLGLIYMVVSRISTEEKRGFHISSGTEDAWHIVYAGCAVASLTIGIIIAGILPHILGEAESARFASSEVLSGGYADDRMNDIFDAENEGIERLAKLNKVSYRVPFNGTVGRQINQFTGETQLVVKASDDPDENLYIRFYEGRNYKNGSWSGGDPEELREKVWTGALRSMGGDQEEYTDSRIKESMLDTLDNGVFTYLQSMNARSEGHISIGLKNYNVSNPGSGKRKGYDLSRISVPIGYSSYMISSGADKKSVKGTDYEMAEIQVPDISACYADLSIGWGMIYPYSKLVQGDDAEYNYGRFMEEMVKQYSALYSPYYLEIPDKGLDKTRQLVKDRPLNDIREITAYIRYILASHASYSLKARDPSGGKDPVEYFLFDSHKGYCEQYATAAAMLYRLYGIPSRYVSGYRLSPGDFNNRVANVPDSKAHAWVEIYLPYTGWIPVEMTPAALPADAGDDVTGYPTDPDIYIWPEFVEGELQTIQEENGWTGRKWEDEKADNKADQTGGNQTAENEKTRTSQQASADASDNNDSKTTTEDKENPVITFIKGHRILLLIIICMILGLVIMIMIMRIMEYRFRHAGIPAIAKRTDYLISHSRNFIIPLDGETAEELMTYLRLLDRVQYGGYQATAEETEWAYDTYDRLVVIIKERKK